MIAPVGAATMFDAVRMGSEAFHSLRKRLSDAGHSTSVGDEGGFAPNLSSAEEALSFIMRSIEKAGYKPEQDVVLALDCAATEFFKDGAYHYEGEGKVRPPDAQAEYLTTLVDRYPIVSIEDGMAEDDWDGWKLVTEAIGKRCQLVGDDLFVTNVDRLSKGIAKGIANSILIKVNQTTGDLRDVCRRRRSLQSNTVEEHVQRYCNDDGKHDAGIQQRLELFGKVREKRRRGQRDHSKADGGSYDKQVVAVCGEIDRAQDADPCRGNDAEHHHARASKDTQWHRRHQRAEFRNQAEHQQNHASSGGDPAALDARHSDQSNVLRE
jgi:hypothetical protein